MAIVGLVLKREAPEALEAARPIVAWCSANGVEAATEPETADLLGIPGMTKSMMFDKAEAIVRHNRAIVAERVCSSDDARPSP